jgi:hypothetical protein
VNSFRSRGRQIEFVVQIIGMGFLILGVLGTTVGFYFGAWAALSHQRVIVLNLLLWIVFLVWQLGPVLFEGYSPGLNFSEIARYPISFRLYFFLNSIYGLADPAAFTCLLWLAASWMGIVTARPEWALPAAGLFLLFAAFNVLCNRLVIGLLERFQSTRRGREVMVVFFLLLMLAPQALQLVTYNWGRVAKAVSLRPLLSFIGPVNRISPPGVTFEALSYHGAQQLVAFGLLVVYTSIVLLLSMHQARGIYQGEIYSEGAVAHRELKVRPGWLLPGLDVTISAIIEKEIRYMRQNLRMVVQLLYPAIIFGILVFSRNPATKFFTGNSAVGVLVGFAAFSLLGVTNVAYNIFGMDREGFGRWMLAPLSLQKIIVGKNLAQAAIFFLVYLLVGGSIVVIFGVPLLSFITVTIAFIAVLTIQFGVGNICSSYWPKKIDLTKMSSRMASNAAGYTSLLVVLPVGAISALVIAAAHFWQLDWLPLVASVVALAGGLKLYSVFLNQAVERVYSHSEEIETALIK